MRRSEIDPDALAVTQHRFPGTILLGDIKEITADTIARFCELQQYDCLLLTGGPPCKQLSVLATNRCGLAGKDSSLFFEFVRIRDIMRAAASRCEVPFHFLCESVVPEEAQLRAKEIAFPTGNWSKYFSKPTRIVTPHIVNIPTPARAANTGISAQAPRSDRPGRPQSAQELLQ